MLLWAPNVEPPPMPAEDSPEPTLELKPGLKSGSTKALWGRAGDPISPGADSIYIIPTLGPKVYKQNAYFGAYLGAESM